MSIIKTAKVWLGGATGVTAPIHLSQYDTAWSFIFSIYDGSAVYVPSAGSAVILEGRKPDGTVFAVPGVFADGNAVVSCTPAITAAVGVIACELRVSEDGVTVGTANFDMIVAAAPLRGYIASGDDFSAMQQILVGANEVAADAEGSKNAAAASAAEAALSAATAQVQAGMAYKIAATAAAMTDTSIGYVYTGTETGYVNGGWYYYNGSAWTLGGTAVDPTLSVAGAAADAAACGDLKSALDNNTDELDNMVCKELYKSGYSTRIDGYIITEDGNIVTNNRGYYIENISATPRDTCTIILDTSLSYEINTRIHGYIGDTWVQQIGLIVKPIDVYSVKKVFVVPDGVDNIKVSTTTGVIITLYNNNYIVIDDINKNLTTLTNDVDNIEENLKVNIINSATRIDGYSILEDGTIVSTEYGCYYENLAVDSSDKCLLTISTTIPSLFNIRVHGYVGDTWVEQISLIVKPPESFEAEGYFTIPSGIDNIKISTNLASSVSLYRNTYTTIDDLYDKVDHLTELIPEHNVFVNMGNPYAYVSQEITDEILDSKVCDDIYAIYDTLVTNYPQYISRLPDIGYDESGLPIRLYRLCWQEPWLNGSGHEAWWDEDYNIYSSSYDWQKLWLSAGTHGNEKSNVYGVALSIKEIIESNESFAKYIRGNLMIDICPIVNPWGFNNTSRNGYHVDGLIDDINRDFLTRTRSESQAVYNRVTSVDYDAFIDTHNSGGNANYFGTPTTNPLKKLYVQMNMKLGGIVYESWSTLTSGEQYAVAPYLQCWVEDPKGMMQDMMNILGIPGYLIESVGVYKAGLGVLTPNHKKFCKFTKDMVINSLIALGTYKLPHVTP